MKAVILAGGKGRRLAPYTTVLPKPLMPIGNMPILEVVVRQLGRAGFDEITMAVGYLAELLIAYFGDGKKFGANITYSREEMPLGTAGPLSLIKNLNEPFIVMNGDLLTTIDFNDLWNHHNRNDSIATLATFKRDVKIDLGVIETDQNMFITGYIEKPTYHYTVSTGVYVFSPKVLEFLPIEKKIDLPELILELLNSGNKVSAYPFEGYWLDIGRPDDYERAIEEFEQNQDSFLPSE